MLAGFFEGLEVVWGLGDGEVRIGSGLVMKLVRDLLRAASTSTASASRRWSRSSWLVTSSVRCGDEESSSTRPAAASSLAAWSAAAMAAVAAMELAWRSDGAASARCEEALERSLVSPMGKIPESKLAQPKFFLSDAYRRRIFFNYERRLRMRSPPEKVFFYFSSVRQEEATYMTAGDLMRAIVPVFPPSGSHLVRVGRLAGERSPGEFLCPPSKFFMMFDTNGDGLISFSEYIFFITLLSIPEKHFRATFRMFDQNENGTIDREEFKKVMAWMRNQNRHGKHHSGGRRTGMHVSGDVENGGLVQLFFGPDGQRQLSMDQFEKFMKELHDEILHLEFAHYDFDNQGTISATDFGLSVTASADLSRINHYLDRVEDLATIPHFAHMRITKEEFRQFATLRKKIPVMALAISSFAKINGKLSKADVQRAAAKICHAPITDAVVDIIFHIFDADGDGVLSIDEFLGVLQRRERDLADPTDTGLVHFVKCMVGCPNNGQKL